MINQPPSRDVKIRRGFTLIELLTVIAIIVILIGILLPVVGAVKRAAYQASTQALITNLTAAIERYRQDFNAYPGAPANSAFDPTSGRFATITMTESMTLALVGGFDPPFIYNATSVGLGPMTLGPIASSRRRYPAYIDVVEGGNFPRRIAGYQDFPQWGTVAAPPIPAGQQDSVMPEFMDAFPDPMPILLLRASTGNTGVENVNGTAQYNSNMLKPYKRPTIAGTFKGEFLMDGSDTDEFTSPNEYFRDPNLQSQPRQKDGFWIISAGPDRRFGTRDDQTNFGGFR